MKEKVCITIGIVGALACSVLAGVSFWSIQAFLLQLDVATLQHSPFFYLFIGSFVGVGSSVGLITKKPSVSSNAPKKSMPKPDKSSEKESVVSSGASGVVITLLPGTKLQNESGTTLELAEHYIMWPKIAASEVPEEIKKTEKIVVAKKRFFERVEE